MPMFLPTAIVASVVALSPVQPTKSPLAVEMASQSSGVGRCDVTLPSPTLAMVSCIGDLTYKTAVIDAVIRVHRRGELTAGPVFTTEFSFDSDTSSGEQVAVALPSPSDIDPDELIATRSALRELTASVEPDRALAREHKDLTAKLKIAQEAQIDLASRTAALELALRDVGARRETAEREARKLALDLALQTEKAARADQRRIELASAATAAESELVSTRLQEQETRAMSQDLERYIAAGNGKTGLSLNPRRAYNTRLSDSAAAYRQPASRAASGASTYTSMGAGGRSPLRVESDGIARQIRKGIYVVLPSAALSAFESRSIPVYATQLNGGTYGVTGPFNNLTDVAGSIPLSLAPVGMVTSDQLKGLSKARAPSF